MSWLKGLFGGQKGRSEQDQALPPAQGVAEKIEALLQRMREAVADRRLERADEIGAELLALGAPAVDRLLALALDDASEHALRQLAIHWLGESGDRRVAGPLYERFIQEIDPATLTEQPSEVACLYRQAMAAHQALREG